MKRLFTANEGTANIIAGHSVIGGKTYVLASPTEPTVAAKLARGVITALDLEFPDHASQLEYMKYVSAAKDKANPYKVGGENYLADLNAGKSPADAAAAVAAATIKKEDETAKAKKAETAKKPATGPSTANEKKD